jgi:pantoate--beta-alanine ligase
MTLQSIAIVRNRSGLRQAVGRWRSGGQRIALVPTMGALHAGHLDIVKRAKGMADRVVVSIFVNPRQFAPHEDLDRYPRDEAGDAAKLEAVGADLIWAPSPAEMYPQGFATRIEPQGAALGLETDFRPQFFGGVTTVVAKLFNQVVPDVALFGEKDFQQLAVIRQMVRDLDMAIEIAGVPTVREADGLALSSRNAYLSAVERAAAPTLHRAIARLAETVAAGGAVELAAEEATASIIEAGFAKIDYVEVRDAETLGAFQRERKGRVLAAAWLGKTRLIDNVTVG